MKQKKFRAAGQIRRGQLLNIYGPGAMLDLPEDSVLMPGLAHWKSARTLIVEPRLAERCAKLLGVKSLRLEAPPASEELVEEKLTGIAAFRFPLWFLTQEFEAPSVLAPERAKWRTRLLVHTEDIKRRQFRDRDSGKTFNVVPIRFVRGCAKGHIDDIDWYDFVHAARQTACKKQRRRLYYDERGSSGDLSEVFLRCGGCDAQRSIIDATLISARAFGMCNGQRRWLGPAMNEPCNQPARLLVRGASNAYFPQALSVISLPERANELKEGIEAVYETFLKPATSEAELVFMMRFEKVAAALDGFSAAEVWAAIEVRRNPKLDLPKGVKQAELETLIAAPDSALGQLGEDEPDGVFYARALPEARWKEGQPQMAGIARVILVHRLREVAALLGFTRFEAFAPDALGDYDLGVERAPLSDPVEWIPARENRGEGVFLLFDAAAIEKWMGRAAVKERAGKLEAAFALWLAERSGSNRKFPKVEYVLLHSFAHLLLTAISLQCGYPASSIRERIYAIPDVGYGVLLFTASSDAEGTLGGIIEAGRNIASLVRRALSLGQLCSSDPVCSEHEPESEVEHRFLHGAACHGCLLVSETCCEMQNDFLDRALVVPTLSDGDHGTAAFFEGLDG